MKERLSNQQIGAIGEKVAERFLVKHGYTVIARNYWKKWGEIDLIATKPRRKYSSTVITHFVEVKAGVSPVSGHGGHGTSSGWDPEDHVQGWKLKRLSRAIQSYLLENNLEDTDWQLDVISVRLDLDTRNAEVKLLPDIEM